MIPRSTTSRPPLLAGALVVAIAALSACSGVDESQLPSDPYARAVLLAEHGEERRALESLRAALEGNSDGYQRALLEPSFQGSLRESQEFRRALHQAAVEHRVSRLQLVPDGEPGEWIEIEGHVVDAAEEPVAGAKVHVFATDAAGRYHPEREGEETPRIFGTLVSDDRGRFSFRTVRPGPYPGTRNPRHIHVQVRAGNRRLAAPGYVVFDDDPLLFEDGNEEPRSEALRITMAEESRNLRGTLVLPVR